MAEDHLQRMMDSLNKASETAAELSAMADRLPRRTSIWPPLVMNAVAAGVVALLVTLAFR